MWLNRRLGGEWWRGQHIRVVMNALELLRTKGSTVFHGNK